MTYDPTWRFLRFVSVCDKVVDSFLGSKWPNQPLYKTLRLPHENTKLIKWYLCLSWHVRLILQMIVDMVPFILQYPWIRVHVHGCTFTELSLSQRLQRKLDDRNLTDGPWRTMNYGSLLSFWIQACNELLLWITKPSSFKLYSKLRFWINVITIFICNTYFWIIWLASMIAIPNLSVSIFQ